MRATNPGVYYHTGGFCRSISPLGPATVQLRQGQGRRALAVGDVAAAEVTAEKNPGTRKEKAGRKGKHEGSEYDRRKEK